MYYRLITLSVLMLFFVTATSAVNAQESPPAKQAPKAKQNIPDINVNDKELEKFVDAVNEVKTLQENAQQKMVDVIEGEGLDAQRFVEINNMQRNPNAKVSENVSEKELENFNNAKEKVSKMQKDMQNKQVKAIEDQGMEVQRYVEIARAAQNDPELRQKIQSMQSQSEPQK